MNKLIKSVTALSLAAVMTLGTPEIAQVFGYARSSVVAQAATSAKPNKPTASLKSGTYVSYKAQEVTLKCSTKNAKIYYSLNGSSYKAYTGPIKITKNSTLKFYSKLGSVKSSTVTRKYKLTPDVDISAPIGFYPTTVTFSTLLKGVSLYYTTDGSKPTKNSSKVKNNKLTLKKSCTLRVLAVKSGWTSKYYTVNVTAEKAKSNDSYLYDYTQKFYYNTLNDTEKQMYEKIFNGILNFEENISLSEFDIDKIRAKEIEHNVRYDNPFLFWCYSTTIGAAGEKVMGTTPIYVMTKEEAEERKVILEQIASRIVAEAKNQPTEYLCIKYIHDEMLKIISYGDDGDDVGYIKYISQADRALIEGEAVCMGYSHAFTYLCQMAGITCFSESGIILNDKGEYGGHIWNKVKIGENWYNIDPTWDDSGDTANYGSFFVTNEQLYTNHKTINGIDDLNRYVTADSTTYSNKNAMGYIEYDTVEEVMDKGMKLVADGLKKGELDFYLYYKDGLKDEVHAKFDEAARDTLKSYGAYVDVDNWIFSDDHVHLWFKPCQSTSDIANVISTCIKDNTGKFTICYNEGVMDGVNINDLLKDNGIFVSKAKATVNDTYAAITLTPFSTIASITKNVLPAMREAANKKITKYYVYYKSSLQEKVQANLNTLMRENGICGLTISGLILENCATVTMLPYETAEDLLKKGMNNVAASIENGVDQIVMYYEKGLKDTIDLKISSLLRENNIYTANVAGYCGDEHATFTLIPYESVEDIVNIAIRNVSYDAKNGRKTFTICYKDDLKSAVQAKLKTDFTKIMKQYGANVTVKSFDYASNHVTITLA